jgi:hypothetical protein
VTTIGSHEEFEREFGPRPPFEVGQMGGSFSITMEALEPWREYLPRLGRWALHAALLLTTERPPRRYREPVGPSIPAVVDRRLPPEAVYIVGASLDPEAWPPDEWAAWREGELRMMRMLDALLAGTYDGHDPLPPPITPPL